METTIGPAITWRLVHNGTDVLMLMESGGYTTTMHTVFEAVTEEECLNEIERLQLTPLPIEPVAEMPQDQLNDAIIDFVVDDAAIAAGKTYGV